MENKSASISKVLSKYMLEIILVILIIVVSFTSSAFLNTRNLFNICLLYTSRCV